MRASWKHAGVSFALLAAVWEMAVRLGWVNTLLVTAPSALPATYLQLWRNDDLGGHIVATAGRLSVSFGLGSALGIAVGVAAAVWRVPGSIVEPLLRALHSTPKMALLPLAFALIGVGDASHELPAFAASLTITALHSLDAARGVPGRLVELARGYGATQWALIRTVYIPACLPQLFTALRISVGNAMVLVVAAEMLTAQEGIGSLIWRAGQSFRMSQLYAMVLLCAGIGTVTMKAITILERQFVPWKAAA